MKASACSRYPRRSEMNSVTNAASDSSVWLGTHARPDVVFACTCELSGWGRGLQVGPSDVSGSVPQRRAVTDLREGEERGRRCGGVWESGAGSHAGFKGWA